MKLLAIQFVTHEGVRLTMELEAKSEISILKFWPHEVSTDQLDNEAMNIFKATIKALQRGTPSYSLYTIIRNVIGLQC